METKAITRAVEKNGGIIMENKKIKEWYLKEYSTDSIGNDLLDNITFYDLFYALDRRKNIYTTSSPCFWLPPSQYH